MTKGLQKTSVSALAKQSVLLAKYTPLFREIGNIKRIRVAGSNDSIAARMFERAWDRINGGEALRSVAVATVAEAVTAAANLGAINQQILRSAQLSPEEIGFILVRAFDSVSAPLSETICIELRAEIEKIAGRRDEIENSDGNAQFIENLKRQPRSGATKSDAPKRVFDQPENHAEHCLVVAVIGALLAERFDADLETVFLIGLVHHFHNAYLPDSGFAGEAALGEFLTRIFESFRRKCLMEVPENLHEKIWDLFEMIETADTPEAQAFHAADVLDRVLQMKHHSEANEFTLKYAMEEAELVHAGAVQTFHYSVLRQAKLLV